MAVINRALLDTGFAIVSVKTTGLTSGYDWICEISIVRADPGQPIQLVLDTLVKPTHGLGTPDIHGILSEELDEAPTLADLAGEIVRECAGRVVVGYNFGVALRFLQEELATVGVDFRVPYIDLMSLQAMVVGKKTSLARACENLGVEAHEGSLSAGIALDIAKLLRAWVRKLDAAGFHRLAQLRGDHPPAFFDSLHLTPLDLEAVYGLPISVQRVSRHEQGTVVEEAVTRIGTYYEELMVALDDLVVTEDEIARLEALKAELGMSDEEICALHARIFAGQLIALVDSGEYDEASRDKLKGLRKGLQRLGWAPGD